MAANGIAEYVVFKWVSESTLTTPLALLPVLHLLLIVVLHLLIYLLIYLTADDFFYAQTSNLLTAVRNHSIYTGL